MRRVAIFRVCLWIILAGQGLFASEACEEKPVSVPSTPVSVLEDYISRHPHSISVVLGAPSDMGSWDFSGEHLYIDAGAKDSQKACLELSWRDQDFLKKIPQLLGKVDYLYVVPGDFRTEEKVRFIEMSSILSLLSAYGKFYYKPAFVERPWNVSYGLLRDFEVDRLPLHIGLSPEQQKEGSDHISNTIEPAICSLIRRHFKKVCVLVTWGAWENTYWGECPLIHQEERDPLSVTNIHKAFEAYFISKDPSNFFWSDPQFPLVLGRLPEGQKKELLQEKVNIGGTIFLHPAGDRPLDVGYGIVWPYEKAHNKPFTLPLSWQDPALFQKLSPLKGKMTHLYVLPDRVECQQTDLDVMDVPKLMRLLAKDAVMVFEPAPRFVQVSEGVIIDSLNELMGIPLVYNVPDVPEVSSLTEKLRRTRDARTTFLRQKFYPHLMDRLSPYFTKIELIEATRTDAYDGGQGNGFLFQSCF